MMLLAQVPALTLTLPYGPMIAWGLKYCETRPRSVRTQYRGWIAIHSGKNLKPVGGLYGLTDLCRRSPFAEALADHGIAQTALDTALPYGAVIALARLRDIYPITDTIIPRKVVEYLSHNVSGWSAKREKLVGGYAPDRVAWLFDAILPLPEPIPARGYQGLWPWTPPHEIILGDLVTLRPAVAVAAAPQESQYQQGALL